MLGRQSADDVRLPYRDIAKDGVEFCEETVVDIDPGTRRVQPMSAPTIRLPHPQIHAP